MGPTHCFSRNWLLVGCFAAAFFVCSPTFAQETRKPAQREFVPTGSMQVQREVFSAMLLKNGLVLIVDGDATSRVPVYAELYQPATGTFIPTGTPAFKRYAYTETLLQNGMVLITGGYFPGALASAELYDPTTGTFTTTGDLKTGRYNHTATLLRDGKVLIIGGMTSASSWLDTAELYDPAKGHLPWSRT
jgi:hypothetical protein